MEKGNRMWSVPIKRVDEEEMWLRWKDRKGYVNAVYDIRERAREDGMFRVSLLVNGLAFGMTVYDTISL